MNPPPLGSEYFRFWCEEEALYNLFEHDAKDLLWPDVAEGLFYMGVRVIRNTLKTVINIIFHVPYDTRPPSY